MGDDDGWVAPGSGGGTARPGPPGPPGPPPLGPPVPVGFPPPPGSPASGYGVPPGGGRKPRTGLVLLLLAGALGVVGVLVVVAITVLGNGDDGEGFHGADPGDAAAVEVPGDYEEAGSGEITVRVPPSWRWVALDDGQEVDGLGEELAPDDPVLADDISEHLRFLPRSSVLVAMDQDDLDRRSYITSIGVLALPAALPDDPERLRAGIERELEMQDLEASSVSYLDTPEGPALRVRYRMPQLGPGVEGLQYWYTTADGPYTLTFSSDDLDDHVEVADAIAASFELG